MLPVPFSKSSNLVSRFTPLRILASFLSKKSKISAFEIFAFFVFQINLPVVDDLDSGWEKFSDGTLQSLSVRASGFAILSIPNLAPAVLYVIL
jgi:hypothetical protein